METWVPCLTGSVGVHNFAEKTSELYYVGVDLDKIPAE